MGPEGRAGVSYLEDGVWNLLQIGSGTHSKDSGKIVTKCHDFHSS